MFVSRYLKDKALQFCESEIINSFEGRETKRSMEQFGKTEEKIVNSNTWYLEDRPQQHHKLFNLLMPSDNKKVTHT